MKLAFSEGPLQLFVDRDFPEETALKLYDNSQQLLVSAAHINTNNQSDNMRELTLSLGIDFEIKCYYMLDSVALNDGYRQLGNGIRLVELRLQKEQEVLYDLNADGTYDLQYSCSDNEDGERVCKYAVWHENEWHQVADEDSQSKYAKTMPNGTVLDFDLNLGQWMTREDEKHPTNAPDVQDEEDN
jgi:hypothetical protein